MLVYVLKCIYRKFRYFCLTYLINNNARCISQRCYMEYIKLTNKQIEMAKATVKKYNKRQWLYDMPVGMAHPVPVGIQYRAFMDSVRRYEKKTGKVFIFDKKKMLVIRVE